MVFSMNLMARISAGDKNIKPFPFVVYWSAVLFLVCAGLADAVYLSISHYRVYTDVGYKSFCAISRAINCDTVSQSPYSIFLGLPVSIWGVIGYTFLLLLLPLAAGKAAEKKRLWALIFWISLVFSAYSVVLAFISSYYIGSYCMMCIVAYGVNLFILFYSWLIRRRFSNGGLIADTREDLFFLRGKKVSARLLFSTFSAGVLLIWIFIPPYWHFKPPPLAEHIPSGITSEGHPWIGARQPVLEITEFTDYQCFQCRKMHYFLRQIISDRNNRIRIVHRNYPMDDKFNPVVKQPLHIGSGKMALLALFAASKDKFWQMNDYLYSIAGRQDRIEIKELAEKLDLNPIELAHSLADPANRYRLQRDIKAGIKLGITGTPAYVINGKVYLGKIPAAILQTGMK
ncbi:MAG: hypothetical protein B6I22_09155 [Desulfobacteraceae bacterium 4572_123]|nr:MAG: hypothetical protein B6I22_09155 [Desulfobacteraceae bacterium 4572_123]